MDDDLDALGAPSPILVAVRTDAAAFRRDMAALRDEMTGTLGAGADAAGRGITGALARAARSGRLEFEDLARVAARALGEIAASALRSGATSGAPAGAGLGGLIQGAVTSLLGVPGRATGGPVAPGAAYVVGERGPELFVPTSSGRVETMGNSARAPVSVTVNVQVPNGAPADQMARSGRQIAREVARVLDRVRT